MLVKKYQNLYQLTTILPFPTNCYIWEREHSLVLVDTAVASASKNIIKQVKKMIKPLEYIILTHAHDDHIGGLLALKEAFPTCEIIIGDKELPRYWQYIDKVLSKNGNNKSEKLTTYQPEVVVDGDMIDGFKVIETPGHTEGSISLYQQEEKLLICGDLFQTQGGFAICGEPRILFPFPAMATNDLACSIEVVKSIALYPIENLACGHGALYHDYNKNIEYIIKRASQRKEQENVS